MKGTGYFTEAEPDVMLTEVHRQAGDSTILRLATLAREGLPIPPGAHDAHVWKMSRHEVGPAQMLQGGQVICGTNATRRWLNTAMKRAAGFEADYPRAAFPVRDRRRSDAALRGPARRLPLHRRGRARPCGGAAAARLPAA